MSIAIGSQRPQAAPSSSNQAVPPSSNKLASISSKIRALLTSPGSSSSKVEENKTPTSTTTRIVKQMTRDNKHPGDAYLSNITEEDLIITDLTNETEPMSFHENEIQEPNISAQKNATSVAVANDSGVPHDLEAAIKDLEQFL